MFGEDVNEETDNDGPGPKVSSAIAITASPTVGSMIWETIKDVGSGLLRGAEFGVSASAGAVGSTIALVLLPTPAGVGSDNVPRNINPLPIIPPNLKRDHNTNGVKSKLEPDTNAGGDHSSFKTGKNGKITGTATYEKNPKNPSGFDEKKRVDVTGKPHYDKKTGKLIPTPHVKDGKVVRPAKKEELPKQ